MEVTRPLDQLAGRGPVLAVVAHPDDESFGLGAILSTLAVGTEVRVLCFTHGEASTLGGTSDLGSVRRAELERAADVLGVAEVTLHDYPDGHLIDAAMAELELLVLASAGDVATIVVFEPDGVTGHPDHQRASAVGRAVASAKGLALLEWGVAPGVASTLNAELGTAFVGFVGGDVVDIEVDRSLQEAAIACHHTQSSDNPVLRRRLALQGQSERIRINSAAPQADAAAGPAVDDIGCDIGPMGPAPVRRA